MRQTAAAFRCWLIAARRCVAACARRRKRPPIEPGANLDVALITFGPGEEIWERFGHNAIEIRDRATAVHARLYNYGIFDFAQENFFLNFARGLMTYRIAVGDPAEELPIYVAEGRWIVEQELNLTPPQRAKLRRFPRLERAPRKCAVPLRLFHAPIARRACAMHSTRRSVARSRRRRSRPRAASRIAWMPIALMRPDPA